MSEVKMTLRQYYAAKALNGLLSNGESWALYPSDVARKAFKIADAMIAEGNKISKR